MNTHGVTIEQLRERFSYDSETGCIRWKAVVRKHAFVGRVVSSLDVAGYIQVNFGGGVVLKGHRIAWAMHYGAWPDGHIDHINGNRSDNRIANLRCVDNKTNCENKRPGSTKNKTGFIGVSEKPKNSPGKRFVAYINTDKKRTHLGAFSTAEEAYAVYLEAKRKMHRGCTI